MTDRTERSQPKVTTPLLNRPDLAASARSSGGALLCLLLLPA